jgi:hypothetical protein
MNTRSSILTAALLCLAALASVPTASAQYPVTCVTVDGANSGVDDQCVEEGLAGPHTIQIPDPDADFIGGSDGCGLDAGAPVGSVPVPTPELGGDPCLTDFASVTITGTGADTVVHVHFYDFPAGPAVFSDGPFTFTDLYLSSESDLDGDGDADTLELLTCQSNPFNPAANCEDADGDGLAYCTPSTSCAVDEETTCPGRDAGKTCDPNDWDSDNDLISDGEDEFPTDSSNGDPDGDGLLAAQEATCGTDPAKKDTDGDGLHDGEECDPAQDPDTNPLDDDTDNDGFSDGEENDAGTDPTDANSFPVAAPDGCLDSDNGPAGEGICFVGPILYEDQRECDPTDSEGLILGDGPADPADCVPAGDDPCADDPPIICDGTPEPCDFDVPVVCGGDVPAGLPEELDTIDPWDTNGNGQTGDANGQIDLIEQRLFYYDFDEAASSSFERNKDLEGSGGPITGVTLVVWNPQLTGTPPEAFRLHVGDAGPTGTDRPSETLVLEQGPRSAPTTVTCVYTDSGVPHVARNGGQFDGSKADEPCGPAVDAIGQLNAIGDLLGSLVVATMPEGTEPRPLFEVTDGNGDGVPEFVTLNLPEPDSCDPTAQACTDYADPLVLPPEGIDPNEVCGATGTLPGCLVPDDCADPTDCVPEPPCDPTSDPDCVPTPEDPAGDAIPPCSAEVRAQPAYVCSRTNGPSALTPLGKLEVKAGPAGPFLI